LIDAIDGRHSAFGIWYLVAILRLFDVGYGGLCDTLFEGVWMIWHSVVFNKPHHDGDTTCSFVLTLYASVFRCDHVDIIWFLLWFRSRRIDFMDLIKSYLCVLARHSVLSINKHFPDLVCHYQSLYLRTSLRLRQSTCNCCRSDRLQNLLTLARSDARVWLLRRSCFPYSMFLSTPFLMLRPSHAAERSDTRQADTTQPVL